MAISSSLAEQENQAETGLIGHLSLPESTDRDKKKSKKKKKYELPYHEILTCPYEREKNYYISLSFELSFGFHFTAHIKVLSFFMKEVLQSMSKDI